MQRSDDEQTKHVYFEVMGIALAVRGHAGTAGLFEELDGALSAPDWQALRIMQRAFDRLPEQGQRLILSEMPDPEAVGYALAQYERTLRGMLPARRQRSA